MVFVPDNDKAREAAAAATDKLHAVPSCALSLSATLRVHLPKSRIGFRLERRPTSLL